MRLLNLTGKAVLLLQLAIVLAFVGRTWDNLFLSVHVLLPHVVLAGAGIVALRWDSRLLSSLATLLGVIALAAASVLYGPFAAGEHFPAEAGIMLTIYPGWFWLLALVAAAATGIGLVSKYFGGSAQSAA